MESRSVLHGSASGGEQRGQPVDGTPQPGWTFGFLEIALLPVLARNPLVVLEPLAGVRRLREVPFRVEVMPEPNDEDAFARLRHPVVGRVEKAADDLVMKPFATSASVYVLQSTQVILPSVARAPGNLGMLEPQLNVGQVVPEGLAGQPLDVLEQERCWLSLANGADELWNHVPPVVHPSVLSAYAKRLARGATRHQLDRAE